MNILGIDFEDWYHPELINHHIPEKEKKPIIVKSLDEILEWLRKSESYATFFVVGELVKFQPDLIDKILSNGHEVGFHTMKHTRIDTPNFKEEFELEIKEFAKISNKKSKGFRAPTFSLNESSSWLIDILEKNDYIYDSSIVPSKTGMYGVPSAPKFPYKISSKSIDSEDPDGKILEFPILTTKLLGRKIPVGGGFYLRTIPLKIIKNAIRNMEKENFPSTFYIHSWELQPENMPRINLPKKDYFITYHNLEKAKKKMTELLKEFTFTSFEKFLK
jgi:peptidoglycan-N-acetylglucosamine deacetylase